MKVAVYTIAKNEEQFVDRWWGSAKEADYIYIADTGSTDLTKQKALLKGINVIDVNISPWRFDDARNAALAALPLDADYCISLDMDEVLQPGWKKELEKAHEQNITRPRYKYTWSWKEDGTPDLQYGGDKIHSRYGYRWKHPVHETLVPYAIEETQSWIDLEIHHYPDNSKSRSQYFPLLKMSVEEDPQDDRNAFYYARELFFNNKIDLAIKEFKRYLELPKATWGAERAAAYRYLAKCQPDFGDNYLTAAIREDAGRRESKIELSLWYYNNENWQLCYDQAMSALKIKEKPLDYLCEDFAWGALPYDLASIASWNMGNKNKAIELIKKAIEIEPNNKRFLLNLSFFEDSNVV